MKRILLSIPLLLSPYTMVIAASCFLSFIIISDLSSAEIPLISAAAQVLYTSIGGIISTTIAPILPYLVIILPILSTILVIANIIYLIRCPMTAYEAAKYNRFVKLFHIPAYLLNFGVGVLGLIMSVWGIPFLFGAVIVDFMAIAASGLTSIACAVHMRRTAVLTEAQTAAFILLSFIYVADVFTAIYFTKLCKNKN